MATPPPPPPKPTTTAAPQYLGRVGSAVGRSGSVTWPPRKQKRGTGSVRRSGITWTNGASTSSAIRRRRDRAGCAQGYVVLDRIGASPPPPLIRPASPSGAGSGCSCSSCGVTYSTNAGSGQPCSNKKTLCCVASNPLCRRIHVSRFITTISTCDPAWCASAVAANP